MNLSTVQKNIIAMADPTAVERAISLASKNFANDEIVANSNPYKINTSDQVKTLVTTADGPYTKPELNEVIATSTILHLYDGWSYLAEALKASYRSEAGIARHLAYYAELRAAMSILAASGIGIFNNHHVILDSNDQLIAIPGKIATHQIAWLALQEWGTFHSSGVLLGNEINAFGNTLSEWTREFQGTSTFSLTGAEWVNNWGLDLNQFSQDRNSRNEVSYRVNFNYLSPSKNPSELASFISDLWTNTEPGSSSFVLLDQFLVRSALEKIYQSKVRSHLGEDYRCRIENTCKKLGAENYIDFLCRRISPDDPEIIKYAGKTSGVYDTHQYLEVISRSYLLLRIATASTRSLLRNSSISIDDISFWWTHVGTESGLWPRSTPPADPLETWDNINLSLEDFNEWIQVGNSNCWHDLHKDIGTTINSLARTELAALWGIA
ncbi:TPA: hypothetical protein ACXJVA_005548 [Pseudomonas aeruginosa]|uniref:hypothetical protein n=1 Tax=Pseudomonas aeruginosa TaxID=287 RepID=UPI000F51F3EB|nr:hypothetical protein [Pseudomonas aeruginosa]MBI7504559.1 hypothetical protein [Pseudomonas aeruginosa]MBI8276876.1 hypothetical protein [Pseudomonas aeruginosa]MBU8394888.1 hypothetical protein [Pseudomonas aeruginosa]MBV5862867.1 hypothetical protein [Pseudomonas aeruginosa]MCS7649270.1 hypothetical protein [Pseudomonas aeruginosa]